MAETGAGPTATAVSRLVVDFKVSRRCHRFCQHRRGLFDDSDGLGRRNDAPWGMQRSLVGFPPRLLHPCSILTDTRYFFYARKQTPSFRVYIRMYMCSRYRNLFSEKERQRYIERLGEATSQVVARPANNTTLLARYCKDKVPRTCDHAILQNVSRPCSLGESFVSSGNSLTIEMRMIESTALRRVYCHYFYVDRHHRSSALSSHFIFHTS